MIARGVSFFSLVAAVVTGTTAGARVLFEGYYRIVRDGNHVGYVVQRDQVDDTLKQRQFTYFLWQKDSVLGIRQLAVDAVSKVESRSDGTVNFRPLSYAYYEWNADSNVLTKGEFAKELTLTRIDLDTGKPMGKRRLPVPDSAIFSSLATQSLAAGSVKVTEGTEKTFTGFSEENDFFSEGKLAVIHAQTEAGQKILQLKSDFADDHVELFMFADGQPLGSRAMDPEILVYLVESRSQAVGDLDLAKTNIIKVFRQIPAGDNNPVTRSKGKLDALETIRTLPAAKSSAH